MTRLQAFCIAKWLSENRHHLKPPVGNKLLYDGEFKVMLVAGPNERSDYHVDPAEEWFYQLEGDMILKVVENGEFYDVPINEGDTFCLPPNIPHSPQRLPNSIGIVVERERHSGELDMLQWFCQNESCRKILFQRKFFCTDLVKDLPPIINEFYSKLSNRTCSSCGFMEDLPPSHVESPNDNLINPDA